MTARCSTLVALLLLLSAERATAQVSLTAERIYLGPTASPCTLRTGPGAPSGGSSCEFFLSSSTGDLWQNVGGTWRIVTTSPTVTTLNATTSITSPLVQATTSVLTPMVQAAADLTLQPSGDLLLNPLGRDILPTNNYYTNIGGPLKKFLTLHAAELDIETLVAQEVISTIGGQILVAPTSPLVEDFPASGPGSATIHVKHNQIQSGDILWLEGNGQVEFITAITGASGSAGDYSYSVARNLDGSGANTWLQGAAVVNLGSAGSGWMRLYAGDAAGFGPNLIGYRRASATYYDYAPRFVLGNLNAAGYGHSTEHYSGCAGNPTGAHLYLDDSNGLVMTGPAGVRVQITPAGVASFYGDGNGVTNIDGGNIQANTITVGAINASGMSDNVIKNGSFEPSVGQTFGHASALSGWAKDATVSTSSEAIANSCCGLSGPGTLHLHPVSGGGTLVASYLAVPIERSAVAAIGSTYRVSGDVYAPGATTGAFHVIVYEYKTGTGGVRRVLAGASTYPDVTAVSQTNLATCAPATAGWQSFEYTYTPPADVLWASLALHNVSNACGGTYQNLHFDDVEMQKMIGPGHIKANAITAAKLFIGPPGAALNADPNTSDTSAWSLDIHAGSIVTGVTDGKVGTTTLRGPTGSVGQPIEKRRIPIDFNKRYRFHVWARSGGGANGALYAGLSAFNAAGCEVDVDGNCPQVTSGRVLYCASNVAAASITAWTEYNCEFNPNITAGFIAVARTMSVQVLLNYTGTTGWMEVQDIRVEEMVPSTLIRDGAITTDKVFANAITGTKISANSIDTNHIIAATIQGVDIQGNTIGAGHIIADSINTSHIVAGNVTETDIGSSAVASYHIIAGNILSTHIAVGNVLAGHIGAAQIATSHLQADIINAGHVQVHSLTGDDLAFDTISGNHIQSATIGATNIYVEELSALSTDIGTVNAGTINSVVINSSVINSTEIYGALIDGATIIAGSGDEVTLDNSGISIDSGSSTVNKIKWAGCCSIWGSSGVIATDVGMVIDGNLEAFGSFSAGTYNGINMASSVNFYWSSIPVVNATAVHWDSGCSCIGKLTSSSRYKENIRPWTPTNPLAILSVPLVQYDLKAQPVHKIPVQPNLLGMLAEDVVKIAPDIVLMNAQKQPDGINSDGLTAYLLAALKAEDARIGELEKRVKELQTLVTKLSGGKQ